MKIDPKLPESEIDFSEYSEEEVHEYYLEQTDVYGDNLMEQPIDWDERPWEPLGEMSTVGLQNKPPLIVEINPDRRRVGNPYFKVYNMASYKKATHIARMHFLDTGMEYHRDAYKDWRLNSKDIKNIKEFLSNPHDDYPEYTNWQMACWLWNQEYGFIGPNNRRRFMNGKFDDQFKDHPSYVPSNTPIPETWIYDPNGAKKKRK